MSEIPVLPKSSSTQMVFVTDEEIALLESLADATDFEYFASQRAALLALIGAWRQADCHDGSRYLASPDVADPREDERVFGPREPSPAPWRVGRPVHEGTPCCVLDADARLVVNLGDGGNGLNTQISNARRIVAAVNFCRGMTDSALAAGPRAPRQGRDFIGNSVCFFCVRADGSLLVHRRGPECASSPDTWDCGAGKVEFGESPEAAARREIFEEYGLEPIAMRAFPRVDNVFEHEGERYHWSCTPFLALVRESDVRIMEPGKMVETRFVGGLDEIPLPIHPSLPTTIRAVEPLYRAFVDRLTERYRMD